MSTDPDQSSTRSIELGPVEWIEVRNALYAEAARLMEEARQFTPRLPQRIRLEADAHRVRQIARKFEE